MKPLNRWLMARDFDRYVAEIQVRITFLNGYTRSLYHNYGSVGQVCRAKVKSWLSAYVYNRAVLRSKSSEDFLRSGSQNQRL
jgi:hypothetical protein